MHIAQVYLIGMVILYIGQYTVYQRLKACEKISISSIQRVFICKKIRPGKHKLYFS